MFAFAGASAVEAWLDVFRKFLDGVNSVRILQPVNGFQLFPLDFDRQAMWFRHLVCPFHAAFYSGLISSQNATPAGSA
jgi:hypothetical protein